MLSCFDHVIFKGDLPLTNGGALEVLGGHVPKKSSAWKTCPPARSPGRDRPARPPLWEEKPSPTFTADRSAM